MTNRDFSLADILFPRVTSEGKQHHAPLGISLKNRFEHTHVLGGVGQGKTQLIQYLIARDLEEDCCVIVIDNQRQMIPKLAQLGYDMQYISPHYPLAMNIFDMPQDENTAPLLRYVLSAMMEAPLTPRQKIVFEFAVAAVVNQKGNIDTFLRILDGEKFDLSDLEPTTKLFFETQFYAKGQAGYEGTRKEITWRLWALLANPVLREMFQAKDNRVKLEVDRKLILIDADIAKLKDFSGLFGRFFLAQLLQIAHQRFQGSHKPIYVYIDECYYYIDASVVSMLETARKANIGLVLAHHNFSQIDDPSVASAVRGFTSTKFASYINQDDLSKMAKAMHTDPEFIQDQPKLSFALWQNGQETVSIKVPAGYVENLPKHPVPHEEMVERYGRVEPTTPKRVPMSKDDDDDITPTDTL